MKNKAIAVFALAYVLLASTYSASPAFADNHFTIESILNESKQGIEEKFAEFEANGLEIPPTADSLYADGLVKYDEALAFLNSEDFVNAEDPGLEALSLFEDAYQEILKAEKDFKIEQEKDSQDLFELAASITELKNEADEIRDLITINELDISLTDLDTAISLAEDKLTDENVTEVEDLIKSAEDIRDEILKRIEYKAEDPIEQEKRVSDFVDNLIVDLEDVIDTANELGVDDSVIGQLEDLIAQLTDYDDISKVYEMTSESSDNEEVLSVSVDSLPDKVEFQAELVDNDGKDNGEADFKQRNDRMKLSVEIEDQTPDSTFDVLVAGVSVGQITTDEDGEGELDLDSRDGDNVPPVADGDDIEVSNADVALLGTFSLEGEDDDAKDNEDDDSEDDNAKDDNEDDDSEDDNAKDDN
ncbi:MAG: hypothetical protein ACE5GR_05025, partial [Nitrosopumilus sp.]